MTKRVEIPAKLDYENVNAELSRLHNMAADARDKMQEVLVAITDYKSRLLTAEVNKLGKEPA